MTPEKEIINKVASDKELITFLKEFCELCPNYQDNCSYRSEKGNYLITYFKEIQIETGQIHVTPTRINTETGEIQINGYQVKRLFFKDQEMMYMILSNYCQKFTNEDKFQADIIAIKIMDKIGMPADPRRILTIYKRMKPLHLSLGLRNYSISVKRMLNLCRNRDQNGKWKTDE